MEGGSSSARSLCGTVSCTEMTVDEVALVRGGKGMVRRWESICGLFVSQWGGVPGTLLDVTDDAYGSDGATSLHAVVGR